MSLKSDRLRTRILLADEMMLCQALKPFLKHSGFTVVAQASNREEVLALTRKHHPDIIVLDTLMPGMNGLQSVRELHRACPSVRVILLTALYDEGHVLQALQQDVRAFVAKSQRVEDLVSAITQVQGGGIYVGPNASKAVLEGAQAARGLAKEALTFRERQVVQLVAEGKSTKQVAADLKISVKTVGFHRTRLMKKLNIHETAGLVRYAIRHGLTMP